MNTSAISRGADWDFDLLERYDTEIGRIAGDFGLDEDEARLVAERDWTNRITPRQRPLLSRPIQVR